MKVKITAVAEFKPNSSSYDEFTPDAVCRIEQANVNDDFPMYVDMLDWEILVEVDDTDD